MFFDISRLTDEQFVVLMFVLNASEGELRVGLDVGTLRQTLMSSVSVKTDIDALSSLWYQGLIAFWGTDGISLTSRDPIDLDIVGLMFKGMAVLINSADRFLDRVVSTYNIPDGVTATLVPLLDTSKVPAADRYVSTADNQESFTALANELEIIKNELVKDQNADELPIPVQIKRAMAAELEGLIGQVRAGYIRISDLTQRARPLVKGIADTCKDLGIIGGAAYAAYEIIGKILGAIF